MARNNGIVLGVCLAVFSACAGAPVGGVGGEDRLGSQLEQLRQDRSPAGRDALAKYLYRMVSDAHAALPPGATREALYAEGVGAAIAAAEGGSDLNRWVGLSYWLQVPGPFDALTAAAAACQASDARPAVELLAEECGDFLERKGDLPSAAAAWRRATDDASQRADALRTIDKILRISRYPERDLSGVSPLLIAQARASQEHQREHDVCLSTCNTTVVGCVGQPNPGRVALGFASPVLLALAASGSGNSCAIRLSGCVWGCDHPGQ